MSRKECFPSQAAFDTTPHTHTSPSLPSAAQTGGEAFVALWGQNAW